MSHLQAEILRGKRSRRKLNDFRAVRMFPPRVDLTYSLRRTKESVKSIEEFPCEEFYSDFLGRL